MDRLGNIGSHIKRYFVIQSFRKVPTDLFHGLLYIVGHFNGIGTGQHINTEYCGILSIDTTLRIIGRSLERYTRHIPQTDNGTVRIGTYYDIFKLTDSGKTTLRSNRDGDIQPLYRLLTEYTGSRLTVLVFQCVLQILYGKTEICQFIGLRPYLHGIIPATYIRHTPHTGNTTKHIEHIDSSKVTQIDFIEFRIGRSQTKRHQLTGCLLLH